MPTSPPDPTTSIFAILPTSDELQAIGEYYIRFSQMDAWLDLVIGKLLSIDWPSAQSVTANANMRAKIDMINSLLALRVQNLGKSENRSAFIEVMKQVSGINDDRTFLAHGKYVLPLKPESGGYIVKSRADQRYIHQRSEPLDAPALKSSALHVKKATDLLMHLLETEFPGFNAPAYLALPRTS